MERALVRQVREESGREKLVQLGSLFCPATEALDQADSFPRCLRGRPPLGF